MVYLHPDLRGHEFDFNDILMGPYKMPNFPRSEVRLTSHVTRDIELEVPFLSAPMDTVTEYEMAIMLGLLGGVGVIHYNFPTVEAQIDQLRKVKNYKAAFVKEPRCLKPVDTIGDVYSIYEKHGFYSVPITEDGTPQGRLLGFVGHKEVRYKKESPEISLSEVMVPREQLVTAHRKDTMDLPNVKAGIKVVNAIIAERNTNTLIVIDDEDRPVALVTDRDLRLHERYPSASVDNNKQLYGFLAIGGAWHDKKRRELEEHRIYEAQKAGVDCLIIDQGVVYASQTEIARYIKEHYPEIQVGVGNVCDGDLVKELVETTGKYIDMIKVGVGPGGACITQQELGVGRSQPSAVYECAESLKPLRSKYGNIALVADGGVKSAADITKLLALGADAVMMGQALAVVKESPRSAENKGGGLTKRFRGMGSREAMEAGGITRYSSTGKEEVIVPEGIVKDVPYVGPGEPYVVLLREAVKQSMNKQGFRTIKELQEGCKIRPDPRR